MPKTKERNFSSRSRSDESWVQSVIGSSRGLGVQDRHCRGKATVMPCRFTSVIAKVEYPVLCYDQKVGNRGGADYERGGTQMDSMHRIKMWIGGLTEIGMMLLALAIVAALLVGGNLPFFGG